MASSCSFVCSKPYMLKYSSFFLADALLNPKCSFKRGDQMVNSAIKGKIEMKILNSTAIRAVGYCEQCELLRILFQPNYKKESYPYDFPNVPVSIYQAFLKSASKGTFFNSCIVKYSNRRELVRLNKMGKECRHF